jgi:probable HAF family extracellular repeat protein
MGPPQSFPRDSQDYETCFQENKVQEDDMKKMLWGTLILMFAAVPLLGQGNVTTDASQHFYAARDFSFTSNPNGVWSYGYTFGLNDPFNLYTLSGFTYFSGEEGWFGPIASAFGPGFPLVVADPAGTPAVLDMGPGPSSYTVVRWTASSNRRWDVVGEFFGTGFTTGDVHVLRNGRSLLDSSLNGSDVVQFFRVVSLGKGGTMDFAAGPGPNGDNGADPTGFRAVISPHLYTFTSVDYPGATDTRLFGINADNEAVGAYLDSVGNSHGILLKAGTFTSLEPPGAVLSQARAINDDGTVTGWYQEQSGAIHGFVLQNGQLSSFDVPGAAHSQGLGINNQGDIVGAFDTGDINTSIGFVWKKGSFTTFEVPGSAPGTTGAFGINDAGQVAGTYSDTQGNSYGFLRTGGTYQTIDLPPGGVTVATGINNDGRVVGNFSPGDGTGNHGFVYSRGKATIVNYPAVMSRTRVRGISNEGAIVGFYSPDGVTFHAFVGQPAE